VTTDTYTLGSYTVQGREEAAGLLARWVRICFVQIHYRRYGGDPVQRGTPHPPSGRPWSAELRTTLREADDDTFQRWWDSASDEEGPIVGNPDAAVPLIKELGLWPEHWDEGPSEDTGATPLSDVLDRVATDAARSTVMSSGLRSTSVNRVPSASRRGSSTSAPPMSVT